MLQLRVVFSFSIFGYMVNNIINCHDKQFHKEFIQLFSKIINKIKISG